jgi:hypothetical protein
MMIWNELQHIQQRVSESVSHDKPSGTATTTTTTSRVDMLLDTLQELLTVLLGIVLAHAGNLDQLVHGRGLVHAQFVHDVVGQHVVRHQARMWIDDLQHG